MEEQTLNELRLDYIRNEIEKKFNIEAEDAPSSGLLAKAIREYVKKRGLKYNSISQTTIHRLWGLSETHFKYKMGRRRTTWTFFAQILGYRSWKDFTSKIDPTLRSTPERNTILYFCNVDRIQQLEYGDKITIGFPPYKYSILKYHDDMELEIVSATKGMHHKEGDIIYAEKFEFDRDKLDDAGVPIIFYDRFLFSYDFDENDNLIDPSLGELQIL